MKEIKYTLTKKEIFVFYLRANRTSLLFFGALFLGTALLFGLMWIPNGFMIELLLVAIAAFVFFAGSAIKMLLMYYKSVTSDEQLNSEITFHYSDAAIKARAGGVDGCSARWESLVEVIRFGSILIFRLDEANTIILSSKALTEPEKSELYALIRDKVKKHNLGLIG